MSVSVKPLNVIRTDDRLASRTMLDGQPDSGQQKTFLFIGNQSAQLCEQFKQSDLLPTSQLVRLSDRYAYDRWSRQHQGTPTAVVCDAGYPIDELRALKQDVSRWQSLPLILYSNYDTAECRSKALVPSAVAEDFLHRTLGLDNMKERIAFLSKLKKLPAAPPAKSSAERQRVSYSFAKRAFDVVVAGLGILLASPILLLITVAIKLESRGPVFFVSKRAGAKYKVFNFYKFRSMRSDADKMRNDLKSLNTYYAKDRNEKDEPFFFKVKNDPRVTRVGRLLRKTSLDELPQLFNVLKGDMSLVGNRPLPLDEGATLTIDRWADRFLAPAGMTGLWQIASNKDSMSVSERIDLDLAYVKNSSFSLDMKILLKTLPAMLQKD